MYAILISGPPASGKTTFAKYASNELNILFVSKDTIKEILFDTIGFKNRNEKINLNIASNNIINYFLENIMIIKSSILIESNFENTQKDAINYLIKKYNYKLINVIFDADINILYNRFIERNNDSNRHKGHITNFTFPINDEKEFIINNLSLSEFKNEIINRGIKGFCLSGDVIKVDTTDFNKVSYNNILCELKCKINKILYK